MALLSKMSQALLLAPCFRPGPGKVPWNERFVAPRLQSGVWSKPNYTMMIDKKQVLNLESIPPHD